MARVNTNNISSRFPAAKAALLAMVASAWLTLPAAAIAAGDRQARFDAPDQAAQALVEAARAGQPRRLLQILGPDGRKLVFSGDAVADKLGREKFVAAYEQANRIELQSAARAILVVGEKQWPVPIPLVKRGTAWRFDTRAGVREILDRRIGRNELGAIEVCRAYVDAQRDYATLLRRSDGLPEYAQHFMSSPGDRDGLYWPAGAGESESPMGPLVASARAEGYAAGKGTRQHPTPYHGYFYRILKRQGEHAPDGARRYLVDGHMIGGFALVAGGYHGLIFFGAHTACLAKS